MKEKERVAKN